jgi:putative Mn2+ efflux pump MntP
MVKLFFKKFFIAISAILFIFLCGVIGLGILFFIIWLFSIAKWLAAPVIIIIMALVYASVETYQEWNIAQQQKIVAEVKMLRQEQKKLHAAAVAETDYAKALEYCEQIDKIEDKIRKLGC